MDGVTVRALGGFDVFVGDHRSTPSAPKPRQVLAVLSLRCGETVGSDLLIDELWGSQPPRRALAALQTHVYELRKDVPDVQGRPFLLTRSSGYAVDLAPDRLDVTQFDQRVAAGAAALDRRDPTAARLLLGEALMMSAGQPLANVNCGEFLAAQVVRIRETRLRALELRFEADLLLGRDDEVIGELRVAVADHPYHEGLVLKLMTALHRRGRRTEALEAYRALRRRLVDELGVEPGAEVQRLQGLVIGRDAPSTYAPTVAAPGPARLPRDIPDFVGRDNVVRRAEAHLVAGSRADASPIVTVTGMAGVGKTATAVHLGNIVRDHFPDGQAFLTRKDGWPADLTGLAERLLSTCGLAAGAGDAVSAFRSWCADRRVLVVLDDLATEDQVQVLLPDGSRCAAIVTRRSMGEPPGAHHLALEPMDADDGTAFLSRLVPGGRVAAEPAAAKAIVDAVGGLPLALRHIGYRLAGAPTSRLDAFLLALTDALERHPLSEVSVLGAAVHERLLSAYLDLAEPDRALFRLLSLLRENNFTTAEVGRALLLDPVSAEMALLRLADSHLVRSLGDGRYAIHALMRHLSREHLIAANRFAG